MAKITRTGGTVATLSVSLQKALKRSMYFHNHTYADAATLMGVSNSSVWRLVTAKPGTKFLSGVLQSARDYVGAYPAEAAVTVESDSTPAKPEPQLELPLVPDEKLASRVAALETEVRRQGEEIRNLSAALLKVLQREVS